MVILPIILMTSVFTGLCAESLPVGFKFKSPDGDKRTSFISQFKEYQETKEKAANPELGRASLEHDSSLPVEAHDTIEDDKEVQVDFVGRCKQFIVQLVAYFSFSK